MSQAIPTTISKAWACLRTSTFVHRSDDRTTNARAHLMAPRHCIVVWPAHLTSQLIRAWQSKRPKRLMAASSFAHRGTALLPQAAYSDYQIGAFENFHQLVENTLIVLRPGPKVFFQYELRFANRLKSQLLIGHRFLLIKQMKQMPPRKKNEKSSHFWEIPPLSSRSDQFLFQYGTP
jgi:hypothetical protein